MIQTFTLFSFLTFFIITSTFYVVNASDNYVHEACSVTRYQDICVKSLASYSNQAERSPSKWARAGVSVTVSEIKLVFKYLNSTKKGGHIRGTRNKAALVDCVECIQDALDNAHKSLGVLRRLNRVGFKEQMGDALTWLSAALTNEDTCINGFEGGRRKDRINKEIIARVCDKVQNASYITSNALALVNKLATTGLQDERN